MVRALLISILFLNATVVNATPKKDPLCGSLRIFPEIPQHDLISRPAALIYLANYPAFVRSKKSGPEEVPMRGFLQKTLQEVMGYYEILKLNLPPTRINKEENALIRELHKDWAQSLSDPSSHPTKLTQVKMQKLASNVYRVEGKELIARLVANTLTPSPSTLNEIQPSKAFYAAFASDLQKSLKLKLGYEIQTVWLEGVDESGAAYAGPAVLSDLAQGETHFAQYRDQGINSFSGQFNNDYLSQVIGFEFILSNQDNNATQVAFEIKKPPSKSTLRAFDSDLILESAIPAFPRLDPKSPEFQDPNRLGDLGLVLPLHYSENMVLGLKNFLSSNRKTMPSFSYLSPSQLSILEFRMRWLRQHYSEVFKNRRRP